MLDILTKKTTNKDHNSNVQEINNVVQVTSDIEILNLVEAELSEYCGPQLSQQQQITHSTDQNIHSNNK